MGKNLKQVKKEQYCYKITVWKDLNINFFKLLSNNKKIGGFKMRNVKKFVSLYLNEETFQKVEKARGKIKRSTFIEDFIGEKLEGN